tara:strand:- start:364 stop:693 length:330 start_codon:yes stop_codon:yes gene_type:complete
MATDTIRYHEIRIYAAAGDDISAYETHLNDNKIDYQSLVYTTDAVADAKAPLLSWGFGDSETPMESMDWPCIIYKDRRYENGDMSLDVALFAQTVDDLESDFVSKAEKV